MGFKHGKKWVDKNEAKCNMEFGHITKNTPTVFVGFNIASHKTGRFELVSLQGTNINHPDHHKSNFCPVILITFILSTTLSDYDVLAVQPASGRGAEKEP